jgi:hypothetical protein
MFHARKPRSVAFWSFEKVSREIKQGSGVPFCPRMETLNGKPGIRKPKGQNERTGRNTKCRQAEGLSGLASRY